MTQTPSNSSPEIPRQAAGPAAFTRADLGAVGLLVASLVGLFRKPLFTSALFFYRDICNYTYPTTSLIRELCRHGFSALLESLFELRPAGAGQSQPALFLSLPRSSFCLRPSIWPTHCTTCCTLPWREWHLPAGAGVGAVVPGGFLRGFYLCFQRAGALSRQLLQHHGLLRVDSLGTCWPLTARWKASASVPGFCSWWSLRCNGSRLSR